MRITLFFLTMVLFTGLSNNVAAEIDTDALRNIELGTVFWPDPGSVISSGYYEPPKEIRKRALNYVGKADIIFFESMADFYSKMGFSADASFSFGMYKASAGISTSKIRSSSKHTVKFAVFARKDVTQESVSSLPLTDIGRKVLETYREPDCDPWGFISASGGHFVQSVIKGGLMVVEFSLEVSDQEKLEDLRSFIKGAWKTGEASMNYSALSTELNSSVTGNISVFQIGGTPDKSVLQTLGKVGEGLSFVEVARIVENALLHVKETNSGVIEFQTAPVSTSAEYHLYFRDCQPVGTNPIKEQNKTLLSRLGVLTEYQNELEFLRSAYFQDSQNFKPNAQAEISSRINRIDNIRKDLKHLILENLKNEFNKDYKTPREIPNLPTIEPIKAHQYLKEGHNAFAKMQARFICISKTAQKTGDNYKKHANSWLDLQLDYPQLVSQVLVFGDNELIKRVNVGPNQSVLKINYLLHATEFNDPNGKSIAKSIARRWVESENSNILTLEVIDVFGESHRIELKKGIDSSGKNCNVETRNN